MEPQAVDESLEIQSLPLLLDPASSGDGTSQSETPLSQTPGPAPNALVPESSTTISRSTDACKKLNTRPLGPRPELVSRMQNHDGLLDPTIDMLPVKQDPVKRPLQLLDLPIDVLADIIQRVSHTNDLIALTLCHSGLHRLAIPHLYSRFDIVWPDNPVHGEQRSGVDALTYGLATLVMGEEIFGEAPGQQPGPPQRTRPTADAKSTFGVATVRRRKGNYYAQYTRKFSLGNGPADLVQEYLISKEGGKMLGTLVALAVARMRSLETFIWDMPTGILRDVWSALSSLGDREDDIPCRLEKLWVRWHDNSSTSSTSPILTPPPRAETALFSSARLQSDAAETTSIGVIPRTHPTSLERVVSPTFSIISPIKSLTVLDIDELAYLDEIAVLIGNSIAKLRELRIGIARHAVTRQWTTVWQGDHRQQVDHTYPTLGSLTIGEKRLGGVLGVLTGFVCDLCPHGMSNSSHVNRHTLRRSAPGLSSSAYLPRMTDTHQTSDPTAQTLGARSATEDIDAVDVADLPRVGEHESLSQPPGFPHAGMSQNNVDSTANVPNAPKILPESVLPGEASHQIGQGSPLIGPNGISRRKSPPSSQSCGRFGEADGRFDGQLQLDVLELERVALSVPVLQRCVDWTRMTSLTLLHCHHHEQLWKALRRTFAPRPRSPIHPSPLKCPGSTPRKPNHSTAICESRLVYSLKLSKVHTNTVSPSLMAFLREALAPNTLEVLFLQDTKNYSSTVNIDAIFKGPLKRHRGSLKKVLIDSSEKDDDVETADPDRWKKWVVKRDVLSFICSGKMPQLRELSVAIDYRDWHFFLQRLPSVPHLRSLYLPFLAGRARGTNIDAKELALQIVDIVALRPEVELCYIGLATKCFEILENSNASDFSSDDLSRPGSRLTDGEVGNERGVEDDEGEDDDPDRSNHVDETESEDDGTSRGNTEDDSDDDGVEANCSYARLRLREILFYDDKVAIFKARHGRL